MFGNNSFGGIEDLFNQLANQMGQTNYREGEHKDANSILLSRIDDRKKIVLIFDLSGKVVKSVIIKEDSNLNEYGEKIYNGNKIIEIIYNESEVLKYSLPDKIKRGNMSYKQTNGILEVTLKK